MYPDLIVLDVYGWLPRFYALAQQFAPTHPCCQSPFFVPDLITQIIDCLRDRRRATRELTHLMANIGAGLEPSHGDYVPPAFAPHVREFGLMVLSQLDHMRVWLLDGTLPYHHFMPSGVRDLSSIYLKHTYELPP